MRTFAAAATCSGVYHVSRTTTTTTTLAQLLCVFTINIIIIIRWYGFYFPERMLSDRLPLGDCIWRRQRRRRRTQLSNLFTGRRTRLPPHFVLFTICFEWLPYFEDTILLSTQETFFFFNARRLFKEFPINFHSSFKSKEVNALWQI